jgi:hypothetical protein
MYKASCSSTVSSAQLPLHTPHHTSTSLRLDWVPLCGSCDLQVSDALDMTLCAGKQSAT